MSYVKSFKAKIYVLAREVLKNKNFSTTWYIDFAEENGKIWSVVLCWHNEYGKEMVLAKVAYRSKNSAMTEYDIDFVMPYDEKTSEVDDTEVSYTEPDLSVAKEIAADMDNIVKRVRVDYLTSEARVAA